MEQVTAMQLAGLVDVHTGAVEKRRPNRYRFRNDEQVLGAWVNASTVFGKGAGSASEETPGPATTPEAGGDVRPAA
jgi:hypothetical protein